MTTNANQHTCERCNAPARVHIGAGPGRQRAVRHFCLDCADQGKSESVRPRWRLNSAALLFSVGAIILGRSAFAHYLVHGYGIAGGWMGKFELAVGVLLLALGIAYRRLTVILVGCFVLALDAAADCLRLGRDTGLSFGQLAGVVLGLALCAIGIDLAMRRLRECLADEDEDL